MARIKAVRDFAGKMPRSNGKTGSLGFCGVIRIAKLSLLGRTLNAFSHDAGWQLSAT